MLFEVIYISTTYFLAKSPDKEIHAIIFLQFDWLLREIELFQRHTCFNVAPAEISIPMTDFVLKTK